MKKLSEILREKRLEHGYTLEQVEKAIKIKKEFLIAIEENRYPDLPSDTYAAGFVKNYGQYLGMPEQKILALFRRDYKSRKSEYVPTFRKKTYTKTKGFFFSLKGGVFLLVAIVILIYLGFQFSSIFLGPELTVTAPQNKTTVDQNVVEVMGETDPYAILEINGESTYVGLDGAFRKSVYVFSGEQNIRVVAKNRFGKETVSEVIVNVK
ncbi:MAG TPA: helix-turn-helix domain-containing protein [Candidatus Levybacteria bacterium]|nr:helix-turn-helix domain-containing protein [Candidatus Levybacteria bacterium]